MFKYVLFCVIACASLSFADNYNPRLNNPSDLQHKSFDVFTLAQSWPIAACWDLNSKWSHVNSPCSPCRRTASKNWTLHGLWPSNLHGRHPAHCADRKNYASAQMDINLRSELQRKWPSHKLSMSDDSFWNYEWKKHGTCASGHASTNSLKKYFNTAFKLLDEYNMGRIFEEANIHPGHDYEYSRIVQALSNALGVNGFFGCGKPSGSSDRQYLLEIYICFDTSFQLTDCNNKGGFLSSCNKKQKITYAKNIASC
ncbi:ribonuclease Oy isoform X1 [Nasonia vitripennis]|uniref:Uncharacterized protein n=1 Tax=Nasonia vitripennis TaxID=7425 RepID=A0A7M7IRY0_NASVI|nr:ribonuclease Oy isoform X1 [Nasonia vitripennis]